jgi:hypothetical protein
VQHTVLFVLGLKGTMAKAELHFLRMRLQGGKLDKAKKGELRFPLPVGFCNDEQGHIILDADEEVRGAVAFVFRLFRETGSAFAVVQRFAESGLRFPKRAYGGAWAGKLIWGRRLAASVISPLRFAMTSPPSGCQRDFHPRAVEHARHTTIKRSACGGALSLRSCSESGSVAAVPTRTSVAPETCRRKVGEGFNEDWRLAHP